MWIFIIGVVTFKWWKNVVDFWQNHRLLHIQRHDQKISLSPHWHPRDFFLTPYVQSYIFPFPPLNYTVYKFVNSNAILLFRGSLMLPLWKIVVDWWQAPRRLHLQMWNPLIIFFPIPTADFSLLIPFILYFILFTWPNSLPPAPPPPLNQIV